MRRRMFGLTLGSTALGLATANTVFSSPLHVDIEPPAEHSTRTVDRSSQGLDMLGPTPMERQNPSAIASADRLLPEPDPASPATTPRFGSGDFGTERPPTSRPDRRTKADSTLHYSEVFNPSIVPFKRMSAYDRIASDYTLSHAPDTLHDVSIGGHTSSDRDLFWASLTVELRTGHDIPIPSVAPDMRILSYEIQPNSKLEFSKDSADNYYVRTEEGKSGPHRLVFLADADPQYFAPRLPQRDLLVRELPRDRLPNVPLPVAKTAKRALTQLQLSRDSRVRDALDKLTHYFREFAPQDPMPAGDDIYWDLFRSQAGVCRHRSFAFVITANALGIPSRFVANEAHAWVEVWLPGGWQRIDLGGAADRLEVSNGHGKTMYRPRGPDPFARPQSYRNGYTELAGDIEGLSDAQIAARQAERANSSDAAESTRRSLAESISVQEQPAPTTSPLPAMGDPTGTSKEATTTQLQRVSTRGYRGEPISVSGTVTEDDGEGLPGHPVEIFLVRDNDQLRTNAILLGRAVTDASGVFTLDVTLPDAIDLANYQVFAVASTTEIYQGSISE